MVTFVQRLRHLWGRQSKTGDNMAVKERFKVRYWHFKSLLRLNERAMVILSLLEQASQQSRPIGMPFIRGHITSLSIHVYKIIQELNQLSDHGYPGLFEAFERIQEALQVLLSPPSPEQSGPLIRPVEDLSKDDAEKAGRKMAVLGEIKNRVYPQVPDGFVMTVRADQVFTAHNRLDPEINRIFQSCDPEDFSQLLEASEKIRQVILDAPLPSEVAEALEEGCRHLALKHGKEVLVAVRSSAVGEDEPGHSFAGLYTTELNVSLEDAAQAYKKVLAGKYTARAIAYRRQRGLRDDDAWMAAGCLPMVDSMVGGVVYSRDPTAIEADKLVVNAAAGLGQAVVDGSVSPAQFLIEPGPKQGWIIHRGDLPDQLEKSQIPLVITDSMLANLATLARRLERYFGSPQDVEWALDANAQIIILQARPLQGYKAPKHSEDQPKISKAALEPLMHGGITASPGAGCGTACLVKRREDMLKFRSGDVLVVEQALPLWSVLLKQAAAVVADTGGMVGHFATVAREFGVPALLNTHEASRIIGDGQLITVDADGGDVFPGRVDHLLQKTKPNLKPFDGENPTQQALKKMLQRVAPLHLTHPYEVDFIPERCLTYHDIIRFCHEKAISELFSFGSRHGCLERIGKRLLTDVPMQLWIINLDEESERRRSEAMIRLEDMTSPAFLAIWKGVTAVPWAGPPAPDMKGFFSVLAGSTMNPALEAGSPSLFSRGNCAIVSGNFCNLSLRWGYHFSIIQAFWGKEARENYVRFQFQGGAADAERRHRRMTLIQEILEQYGFHVQITHDNMTAQLEGCESEFLEKRLRLIGYISLHAGQIDMIMGSRERARAYKLKMLSDITKEIFS
jgi:pyruvate, water dikinase